MNSIELVVALLALVGVLVTAGAGIWIGQARVAAEYAAAIKTYRDELDNEIKARRIDRDNCAKETALLDGRILSLEQNGRTYELRFEQMMAGIRILTEQIQGHDSKPDWTIGDLK